MPDERGFSGLDEWMHITNARVGAIEAIVVALAAQVLAAADPAIARRWIERLANPYAAVQVQGSDAPVSAHNAEELFNQLEALGKRILDLQDQIRRNHDGATG